MNIRTSREGDRLVVFLDGELDYHAMGSVETALKEALPQASAIVVDLSAVPFADSSGLGVLIAAYKQANAEQKTVVLRKPTPIVSEILAITRMKRFFTIEE